MKKIISTIVFIFLVFLFWNNNVSAWAWYSWEWFLHYWSCNTLAKENFSINDNDLFEDYNCYYFKDDFYNIFMIDIDWDMDKFWIRPINAYWQFTDIWIDISKFKNRNISYDWWITGGNFLIENERIYSFSSTNSIEIVEKIEKKIIDDSEDFDKIEIKLDSNSVELWEYLNFTITWLNKKGWIYEDFDWTVIIYSMSNYDASYSQWILDDSYTFKPSDKWVFKWSIKYTNLWKNDLSFYYLKEINKYVDVVEKNSKTDWKKSKKILVKELILSKTELNKSSKWRNYIKSIDLFIENNKNNSKKLTKLQKRLDSISITDIKNKRIKNTLQYLNSRTKITLLNIGNSSIVVNKTTDMKRIDDISKIRTWVELYYSDYSVYPDADNLYSYIKPYLSIEPKDSLEWEIINWCEFGYKYEVFDDDNWITNQEYILSTCLEKKKNGTYKYEVWFIFSNKSKFNNNIDYDIDDKIINDTVRINDVTAINSAIIQYYQDNAEYPNSQNNLYSNIKPYLSREPKDNLGWEIINWCKFGYKYEVFDDENNIPKQYYLISTCLEDVKSWKYRFTLWNYRYIHSDNKIENENIIITWLKETYLEWEELKLYIEFKKLKKDDLVYVDAYVKFDDWEIFEKNTDSTVEEIIEKFERWESIEKNISYIKATFIDNDNNILWWFEIFYK